MISSKNKVVLENIMNYTLYDDVDMEDRLFVSWGMFEKAAEEICAKIGRHLKKSKMELDGIYGVPKGGLVLAVKLCHMIKIPMISDPLKITKNTLIVDDCTKSGRTLGRYRNNLKAVMFHNPDARCTPDFYFRQTRKQINFCWESREERN